MGRFREITRGSLDVDIVEVEFVDGTRDRVGLRLLFEEEGMVLEKARSAAVRAGVQEPRTGNPIYDRWEQILRVYYGAVDPAAPSTLYFDSPEQIERHVDQDRICYLAERQALYQARRAIRPQGLTHDQYIAQVYTHATAEAGAELPFWSWHPGLQESFLRSTAALALSSIPPKSPSGPVSDPSSTDSIRHPPSEAQ